MENRGTDFWAWKRYTSTNTHSAFFCFPRCQLQPLSQQTLWGKPAWQKSAQQPEKAMVHKTCMFTLPLTIILSWGPYTHIGIPTEHNRSVLGQEHLRTTSRTKDGSYQGLNTPARFFLFGNDELGFGQIFHTLQDQQLFTGCPFAPESLSAASINSRLLLTVQLSMFVFMME